MKTASPNSQIAPSEHFYRVSLSSKGRSGKKFADRNLTGFRDTSLPPPKPFIWRNLFEQSFEPLLPAPPHCRSEAENARRGTAELVFPKRTFRSREVARTFAWELLLGGAPPG